MKPRWRWWLWNAALTIHRWTGWRWANNLQGWCVLPAWVWDGEPFPPETGEAPF